MSAARALAEEALREYLSDPASARERAEQARAAALTDRDWSVVSRAERALGLVAGHRSDSAAALGHLSSAVRYGERAGDRVATVQARADRAYVLVRCGRSAAALREVDRADGEELPAVVAGQLLGMRALVLKALGRWDDALRAYERALPPVRVSGDQQALAVLLCNRGVVQTHLGRPHAAERDLVEADDIFASLGSEFSRVILQHNLGYVAALRGHVPLALTRYDAAERGYLQHREVPLELWMDRCELLLAAGLGAEARAAARRAVDLATARREPAELAEARLRLAQAALADGDPAAAQELADQAARALTRQRRPGWAALAYWTRLQACAVAQPDGVGVPLLRRAATRLERAGWPGTALEARLLAAQVALAREESARGDLARLRAARTRGPVWHRQLGWHAEALHRLSTGDRPGALRAAARGIALVDEHRATLGATDLRAAASGRAAALAALGLRLATETGRPVTVWSWAERTRAAALLRPPAQPQDTEDVAADLAELRAVVRQHQQAAQAAESDPALVRRQVQLEERIRRAPRRAASTGGPGAPFRPGEVLEALGERALVEFAAVEGRLTAVVAVDGRVRVHPLGRTADVAREMHHLFFALRRMAGGGTGLRGRLAASAARIDAAVLAPLAAEITDRDLVVVPTEPLHALPWSVLPSVRGRAVSVAPSAALWLTAARRPVPTSGSTVLVAGPDLVHAELEVKELAELHRGAVVLTGERARVADVLAATAGAGLVHLAAHGRFRADAPQFSALDLADGPLTGHDVERLADPPGCAVLSACETGTTAVLAGGELLGLAASLLAIGVRTVVAPVLQVPDAETAPLMTELHRGLLAGRSAAVALATAAERAAGGSDADAATGAAFLCVGA